MKNITSICVAVFATIVLFLPALTHAAVVSYKASDVLGQTDGSGNPIYTQGTKNNASSSVNAVGIDYGNGPALDTKNHRLFVPDTNNNRVLVYQLDENNHLLSHAPDYELGQLDGETAFTSNEATTTINGMHNPSGLVYDVYNDRLFVADVSNKRMLVYDFSNGNTLHNGMDASYELGQPDGETAFTSSEATTTQSGISSIGIFAVAYDLVRGYLFVSDTGNKRVLVYDLSDGITNGMNATYELGQPDGPDAFTTEISDATPQGGFNSVQSLAFDPATNRLFAGDGNDSRVLIFDLSDGITNGMNASYELGQLAETAFTSTDCIVSQSGMCDPTGLVVAENNLFMVDGYYKRIMVYNLSGTIANGMDAVSVIGQTDFISKDAATTQDGVGYPWGGIYDSSYNRLWVSDGGNNRVLAFDFIKLATTTLSGTADTVFTYTATTTQSQGTITFALANDTTLPTGLTLNATTGVISGTPSVAGTYSFSITATDTVIPDVQVFTDTKAFTMTVADAPAPATPPLPAPGASYFAPVSSSYTSFFTPPAYFNPPTNLAVTPLPVVTTPTTLTPPTTASSIVTTLTSSRDLQLGTTNSNVTTLQNYLNTHGFVISTTGAGSPGHETNYFGNLTRKALAAFQKAHGITPAGGYFGPITKKYIAGH